MSSTGSCPGSKPFAVEESAQGRGVASPIQASGSQEVAEAPQTVGITMVASFAPREWATETLELPVGSRLGQALGLSALAQRWHSAFCSGAVSNQDVEGAVGIWGRKQPLDTLLQAGDRIELYRPLRVDPKVARRERFQKQGARSAGLFAQRRPGAKAGY